MNTIPEGFAAIRFIGTQATETAGVRVEEIGGFNMMTFIMNIGEVRRAQDATGLVPYTLSQAAHVFGLIYRLTSAGFQLEDAELCSLAELCQRGLDAVAEKEGEALSQLDIILRGALSKYPKEEADE